MKRCTNTVGEIQNKLALTLKNFSMPMSAPNPASVTTNPSCEEGAEHTSTAVPVFRVAAFVSVIRCNYFSGIRPPFNLVERRDGYVRRMVGVKRGEAGGTSVTMGGGRARDAGGCCSYAM